MQNKQTTIVKIEKPTHINELMGPHLSPPLPIVMEHGIFFSSKFLL